jgi:hypothetical protein
LERVGVLEAKIKTYEKIERNLPTSSDPFYRRHHRVQRVFSRPRPAEPVFAVVPAFVVDTRDPWKAQRIRVYIPSIHRYEGLSIDKFPWALPCNPAGSLDEQGWAGVPPEGSTVWVTFELGHRDAPIWMGARWNVTRGTAPDYSSSNELEDESYSLESGGDGSSGQSSSSEDGASADLAQDGSTNTNPLSFALEQQRWGEQRYEDHNPAANPDQRQLFPPWNNESYNGPDLKGSSTAGALASTSTKPTTFPHIYGWKTPEKHFIQMHDGDFQENLKGKRLVIQSSRGHVLYFKDDCINESDVLFKHKYWDDYHDQYPHCLWKKAEPMNKHDIWLRKTGIWLQSVGGHRLQFHDDYKAECSSKMGNKWDSGFRPEESPLWSKIRLESITEHRIELRDRETVKDERNDQNGIFAHTATGNLIQANDHTVNNKAGNKRGIRLFSTSRHLIDMHDEGCEVFVGRKARDPHADWEDGTQSNTATNGYIRIETGWGQYIMMHDLDSQQKNRVQYIRVSNKNDDNDPNWYQMNCVHQDKLFNIYGAGTYVLTVKHNYYRYNLEGHEAITIFEGNQSTEIIRGQDYRHSETRAYYWNSNIIQLAVGYMIERGRAREIELPLQQIVVAHPMSRWQCKVTNHIHYDYSTPYVEASADREVYLDDAGNVTGTSGREASPSQFKGNSGGMNYNMSNSIAAGG